MEKIDRLKHEYVSAIFKNGKHISYPDFESAKSIAAATYFAQRKITNYEKNQNYLNEYYTYKYDLFNSDGNQTNPIIDSYQILRITSFYNTARNPTHRSYITYSVLDSSDNLLEFEFYGDHSLNTIELLYNILNNIQLSGGIEAFKIINDNKKLLIRGDKLIYDSSMKFW